MKKYTYINNKFIYTPYNHALHIKKIGLYDTAIRLIIYDDIKLIYIRLNDFSYDNSLELKKLCYQFNKNLKACIGYLNANFKDYKIYDSYSINKLDYSLKRQILSV